MWSFFYFDSEKHPICQTVWYTIYDVRKDMKPMFRMYNAPCVEVGLLCDNSVMDAIMDRSML